MQNKQLDIFAEGVFEPINKEYICDGLNAMSGLSEVQKKWNKCDIDTLLNELHDAIVGNYLGFELINVKKHGFDCKKSVDSDIYLESKVVSWGSNNIHATFNDTSFEKAEAFKDEKVWLALSVWSSASELMFIVYGQNEEIGYYLEERVKSQIEKSRRRTQGISMEKLINDYNFNILTITKTVDELYTLLTSKSKAYKSLEKSRIYDLKSYKEI